jgi:hypothetical protein
MAKKKTTVYLDSDVLMAAKAAALTSNQSESAVIEAALRSYLRSGHGNAVWDKLGELLERVASTSNLDEDAALAQAVTEVRAVRWERRTRTVSGG